MLITIDAGALGYPMRTGIGRYLESVLGPLADIAGDQAKFVLLSGRPLCSRAALELVQAGRMRAQSANFPSLYAWQQTGMGAQILRLRPDVHFTPDGLLPLVFRGKSVGALQDVLWKRHPETLSRHIRTVFGLRQKASLKRLTVALTGSESNRREMREVFGPVAEKIRVAPLFGLDHAMFRPLDDHDAGAAKAFREKFGLPREFLFCAGNLMPHKNFRAVPKALARLWRQGVPLPDLLVAGLGDPAAVLSGLPEGFPQERVKTPGYLSDEDLLLAYRLALAFVFPSLYEGYGLPVLEAMASGTPVVYADATSLPEAAGGAGLPFDPRREDALADTLKKIIEDAALREELTRKGLKRTAGLSWEHSAAVLWEAINQAANA